VDDLEKQRTVRQFMISLEKFTPENLINQEILQNDESQERVVRDSNVSIMVFLHGLNVVFAIQRLRDKVKHLMEDKKVMNQIKEHQFATVTEN